MTHNIQKARDEIFKAETYLANARCNLDEALHPPQTVEDRNIELIKKCTHSGPSKIGDVTYNGSCYTVEILPSSLQYQHIWAYESLQRLIQEHGFSFKGVSNNVKKNCINVHFFKNCVNDSCWK